jgi:hypothetical protein
MRKIHRTNIEDLEIAGTELSSESLEVVTGGLPLSATSSTGAKRTGIEMEPIIVVGGRYPCSSDPGSPDGLDYCFP